MREKESRVSKARSKAISMKKDLESNSQSDYPKTPKPLIFHVSAVNNWLTIQINTYFIGEITI